MSRLQIVQSIQRMACTRCGAEANASCNCGVAYDVLAHKKETVRQASKAYRERKREENQSPRHMTDNDEDIPPSVLGYDEDDLAALANADARAQKRDAEIGKTNIRSVFLMNCAATERLAHYEGSVDEHIRAAARRVADAWSTLADAMEKSP